MRGLIKVVLECSMLIVFMVLFNSCGSTSQLNSSAYQDLYQIERGFRHETFIRQVHPDTAYVYFEARTEDLLHKRSGEEEDFKVVLDFKVTTVDEYGFRSDTAQFRYSGTFPEISNEKVNGRFPISLKDTVDYQVSIVLIDRHSGRTKDLVHFLGSELKDDRFMLTLVDDVPTKFCSCDPGQNLTLRPYQGLGYDWIVEEYSIESKLAPPPYSVSLYVPPSFDLVNRLEGEFQREIRMSCPESNALLMTSVETGKKLLAPVFAKDFPKISEHPDLVGALRYITSYDQFQTMSQSENIRKAVETFWLDCGGSRERTKVLIDNFYSRVEEANLYFTGVTEGWRTDRGLIHIIYGPPDHLYKYSDREVWHYGTENSETSYRMVFEKDKDYRLDRSLEYRQSWELTVASWRNGRTISQ